MENNVQIKSILLIGAGNLGKRHMQALLKLDNKEIHVLDVSIEILQKASQLAENTGKGSSFLKFHESDSELPSKVDLVIIATNSNERFAVLENIVSKTEFHYLLLEKVLFPRLTEYDASSRLFKEKNIRAWVNCPRRMFPELQEIRRHFVGKEQNIFNATGNMWGLGCNGIHTYDLYAFLTGDHSISFRTDLLDKNILESKRNNYIEFTGSIYGAGDHGNFFRMTSSFHENTRMPAIYTISNNEAHFIIHRGVEAQCNYALASENWQWKHMTVRTPFQSELTNEFVLELELKGDSWLPSYEESSILHTQLITAFTRHMDEIHYSHNKGECLIS